MFTFMHCVFDLHRFWYALKSAFSALYFPFTLFCFVSSEILETLRSNFLAMNRRLFFTFKYFSIRCRSYKFKCTNSFINSFYMCSDSKVYLQYCIDMNKGNETRINGTFSVLAANKLLFSRDISNS